METEIVDFCASCGTPLGFGVGQGIQPACENCGENVGPRENRIQGEFLKSEADKLKDAWGQL